MAVKRVTYLHEILLRYGPDGFGGAQKTELVLLIDPDTGDILSESIGAVTPLDQETIRTLIGSWEAAGPDAIFTLSEEVLS